MVRRTVRSMFGEQTFAQLGTGFKQGVFIRVCEECRHSDTRAKNASAGEHEQRSAVDI